MSELLVRSKNGIKLYKFEKAGRNEKGEPKYTSKITFEYHGYIHEAIWSVDGSCFLILHSIEGLLIIRNYEANRIINKITCCSKYKDLFNSENVKLIKNVQWSPKNKFIVFFFPYDEQKHSQLGNLLLWSVTYNKVFYSFKIKKKICSNWPIINFTNDDNYFFLLNKFDIYVYDALYLLNKSNNSLSMGCDSKNSSQSDVPKDYVFSWSQSNVTALYISPYVDENHCRYLIVHTKHNFLGGVFIYQIEGLHNYQNNQKLTNINYYQKGQNVIKYDYIKSKNENTNNTSNVFAFATNGTFSVATNKYEQSAEVKEIKIKLLEKKTFDNMDNLNCLWSSSGKYVILLVHTNDTTNKSYGYLCNCFYFSLVSSNYTLKKINEQIAQDVKWNKSEDEFLIIEGKSDNTIILYGNDLKVKCKFFSQYKNTIKWCPFGNMIAIGGFGNLAGDISFYYREKNDSVILVNEYREACTVQCDWSNDGMLFMTASTYPRMKVENVFKIYTYEGTLVNTSNFNELYDVKWKNCLTGAFREPPKPKVNLVDSKKNVYKVKSANVDKKEENGSVITTVAPINGVETYSFRKNSKSEKEKETDKGEKEKDANKEKNKNKKSGSPVIRKDKQPNSFDLDVNWRNKNNRVKKEGNEKEENQQDKENKKDKKKTEEKNYKKMNDYEKGDIKGDNKRNDRRNVVEGLLNNEKGNKEEAELEEKEQYEGNDVDHTMYTSNKELMNNRTNMQMGRNEKQKEKTNINAAEWEKMFEMLERTDESKLKNGRNQEGNRNGELSKLGIRSGNNNLSNNVDDSFAEKDRNTDINYVDMMQERKKNEGGPYRVENENNEMIYGEKLEYKNGYPSIAPNFIPKFDTEEINKMDEFSFAHQIQMLKKMGGNEKQENDYNFHTSEPQQTMHRGGEAMSPSLNFEQTQLRLEYNNNRNNNDRGEKGMPSEDFREASLKVNKSLLMSCKNMLDATNKEVMEGKKGIGGTESAAGGVVYSGGALSTLNPNENNSNGLSFNNTDNTLSEEEYIKRMAHMVNENVLNGKGINLLNRKMINNNTSNRNILNKLCNNKNGNLNYLRELNISHNDSNKITQAGKSKTVGIMVPLQNSTLGGKLSNGIICENDTNSDIITTVNNNNNSSATSFANQENSLVTDEMKKEMSNVVLLKQMNVKKEEATCPLSEKTDIHPNEDIVNLFKKMLPHAKVNVVAQNERGNPQSRTSWGNMKNGQTGQSSFNSMQHISNDYAHQMNFKREVGGNNNNTIYEEQSTNVNMGNKDVNQLLESEKENYIKELLIKQGRLNFNINNAYNKSLNLIKGGRASNNVLNMSNNISGSTLDSNNIRGGGGGGGGSGGSNQEEQMRLHIQSQMNNSNIPINPNANTNVNTNTLDAKKQLSKLNFYELLKCYYTLNVHQIQIRLLWVNLKIENYGETNMGKNPESIEKEKSILYKLKEMGDMSEYISMLLKQFFLNNREKYEDTLKEFSNVILYQDKMLYDKLNDLIRRHSDKPYIVSFIKNIDKIIEYYWSQNEDNTSSVNNMCVARNGGFTNNKMVPKNNNNILGRKTSNNMNMNININNIGNMHMNLNSMNIGNKNNMNNNNNRNNVKSGNKMINAAVATHNNLMSNSSNMSGNANNINKTTGNSLNMNQLEFQKRLLQQKRNMNNGFANALPGEEQASYLLNNGISNYAPKGFLFNKANLSDEQKLALLYKMSLNEQDSSYLKAAHMNEGEKQRMNLSNEHIRNDLANCKNEKINRYDVDSNNDLSSLVYIRQAIEMEQNQKLEKDKLTNDVVRPDDSLFSKKYVLCDILKNKEQAKRETLENVHNNGTNNNSTNNNSNAVKNNMNSSLNESYLDMKKLQQERMDQQFLKQNIQNNTSNELTAQLKNILNANINAHMNQMDTVATYTNQINKMFHQANYVNQMNQTEHGHEPFPVNQMNVENEVNKLGLSDINVKQEHINKQMLQVSNNEFANFKNSSSTATGGASMENVTHNTANNNTISSAFKAVNMTQNDLFSQPRDCNENVMNNGEAGLYARTGSGQSLIKNQMENAEGNLRNVNKERAMEDKKYVSENELCEYFLNEKNKMDSKMLFMRPNKENAVDTNHSMMLNKAANINKKNNVDTNIDNTSFDPPKKTNHVFEMRDTKRPDALRDKCWQYVDLKGVVQGPFYLEEMRVWSEMGFFEPMLPVRCCDMDRFVALNKLFPPPVKPFTTVPKPQPMLQWEEDVL